MKNKKNNNVALVNYVKQLVAAMSKAEGTFPLESVTFTAQDKRRTVKVRKGSDAIMRQIAELVKAHGLDSNALHSEEMLRQLDTASALAPLVAIIAKLGKRVGDAQYASTTSAWQMALQFYALLQTRAQVDGQLAASLEPISAFFAYRHQAVLSAKPTKLQTRMNAKLREAERLVARSKPRASVLEETHDAHDTTEPVAPAPQPIAKPAPAPVVTPSVSIITPSTTNGVTNSASNGYTNGASSNGALNGAASSQ